MCGEPDLFMVPEKYRINLIVFVSPNLDMVQK